uniref:Uncharacterized protein n=1 Tax=Arundo donax TaxID=35708 RepID=A0A0A9C840_ARUDO
MLVTIGNNCTQPSSTRRQAPTTCFCISRTCHQKVSSRIGQIFTRNR